MTDIRLKKISIENNNLSINKGTVFITNTQNSLNLTTASLLLAGGISILNTDNTNSYTAGGSFTVAGGISVYKNVNIGENLTLHNNNSILNIKGITNSRFYVDSSSSYFAPNGIDKRLDINNTSLYINYTSSNGVLSESGIYIKNTTNTTYINEELTALTVLGGVSISKDMYVNNNIKVNNIIYTNNIRNNGDLYIDNKIIFNSINNIYTSNENLYLDIYKDINLNTSIGNINIYQNNNIKLAINSTSTSNYNKFYNNNDFINKDSVSILSTIDSNVSATNGALIVDGGVYIEKNIVNKGKVIINLNNTETNKVNLYQENNDLDSPNITSIGNSIGSLFINLNNNNTSIFKIQSSYGNLLTINQDGDITFKGNYKIEERNKELNLRSFSTVGNILSLVPNSTQGNLTQLKLYNNSFPGNSSSQFLSIYTLDNESYLSTNKTGNGTIQNLNINIGDNNFISFNTSGTVIINTTAVSSNSASASLICHGGLSINNTANAISMTQGGALTIAGGVSINKSLYLNDKLYIQGYNIDSSKEISFNTDESNSILNIHSNNTNPYNNTLNFYTFNKNTLGNYEFLSISNNFGNYFIKSNASGTGLLKNIILSSNSLNQFIINTNGNINMNTDNTFVSIDNNLTVSNNIQTLSLRVNSTQNALSLVNASLIIDGGVSINKNLLLNDTLQVLSTIPSLNYTTASVILNGGMSIKSTENSISIFNGGALTIAGGASVFGDLYVGGSINGGSNSVNIVSELQATSTKGSINSTIGSIVSYGGVSIDANINSTSITQGGSLTINGGMSVNKDIYVGGVINIQNTGGIIYNNSNGNILNINNTSFALRVSSNNLIIANSSSNLLIFSNTSTNIYTPLYNYNDVFVNENISVSKTLVVNGDTNFNSTTISTNFTTGSVKIKGGVGLDGNLNIRGDTNIIGNLNVLGTISNIYSENLNISDNVILLNSAPNGTKNSGFLVNRYQINNDLGTGDIVSDSDFINDTLPSQVSLNLNQIKLPSSFSGITDFYNGYWVKITSGFSNNQVRYIIAYNGTTNIATLETNFTTQNPTGGDLFNLYYKSYSGLVYNEMFDRFEFGNTNLSESSFNSFADILLNNIIIRSSVPSLNSTSGSLINYGGVSIHNTENSISITQGGSMTIAGGVSIGKKLIVGQNLEVNNVNLTPNIYDIYVPRIFNASNNQSSPQNITNLIYNNSILSAEIYIYAGLITGTNSYSSYHIRILNKGISWDITQEYIGDNLNIQFYINNSGQLQYTTPNYSSFTSLQFTYKTHTLY
jgi:hypothetical protein